MDLNARQETRQVKTKKSLLESEQHKKNYNNIFTREEKQKEAECSTATPAWLTGATGAGEMTGGIETKMILEPLCGCWKNSSKTLIHVYTIASHNCFRSFGSGHQNYSKSSSTTHPGGDLSLTCLS